MRYFLQFPSQTQVSDEIIPEIEKLESPNDKSKDLLEIEAFEKHLVVILKNNLYAGYFKEELMEAYKVLDVEKNGYLDLHTFYTYLKTYGATFSKNHISEMEKFLLENENELLNSMEVDKNELAKKKHTPTTTRKFFYEAYVRKVIGEDQKHFESLLQEFKIFTEEYKQKKGK